MTKFTSFLKQRPRWVISLCLVPIFFVAGFLLQIYLSRDVLTKMASLKKELGELRHLKKDYVSLESDRDNVLVQTKRLIADKNRLTELEKAHDELTEAHRVLIKQEARRQRGHRKLKKKTEEITQKLRETLDKIDKLESEIVAKSDSIKTLERALKEKVEKAPEVKQLKADSVHLKDRNSELEREKKRFEGKVKEAEKRLKRSANYKEKYEGLIQEKKQLIRKNRQLSKEIEDVPKRFKDMAHENRTLIKETANMHYNLGVFYTENKRFNLAIGEFKKAADLNPNDPRTYYNLGYLYAEHFEDHQLAREHFRRYLGLDPNDENADQVRNYLLTRETYDAKVLKS